MKIEGTDYIRDEHNHALINTNVEAYKQYKMQRHALALQSAQEKQIASLKDELTQMKSLIQELIREKNG